ncbi:MAG: tetratricopeptide repeat protein [Deltaproteobacteria bacterium]|nr:MAG: tetratricopeptide repeat protein [Deltaproteobacteria bacterium]
MKNWKITGIIATAVTILSVPLYIARVTYLRPSEDGVQTKPEAKFTGSKKCGECHKTEYDKWRGSHHDLAMGEANDTTVLGDFDDAVYEQFGVKSRFYRKNGGFYVQTEGRNGKMDDFEVKYTFGVYPLQQYLVPFPDGRLQCLPIAWDVKEEKWYHLYPNGPIDPRDWLYWTNAGQNWNGMCAECHSTNLQKNYDIRSDSYRTTWSEINVGCEACHGPGSQHVAWAELPDMARPQKENYELAVKTGGISSRKQVELCAPCHSRRAILGDYTHAEPDLLDSLLPSLLTAELYFADGQILEEVYVYGSFTQSKMYRRDVRCSDCHEVHSIKTVKEGNALCLQCHRAKNYDSKEHHFHKKRGEKGEPIRSKQGQVLFEVGTGAECVQCHMPGRYYMGIDYRPDHSFRIPRPDLSIKLDTPNGCNRCHVDETNQWSDEAVTKWYGPGRRPDYGTIIESGRKRLPESRKELIRLATDQLYPVIVRATALYLLGAYPRDETNQVFELALVDQEALIRRTAVDHLNVLDPKRQTELLAAMLYDPVKAVRIEAARRLTEIPSARLDENQSKMFKVKLVEFQQAMEYSADFAFGRYNLGNLFTNLKKPEMAIENYRAAIRIDDAFYPAKVNLAMLYNQMGRNDEAEILLREVVNAQPELYEVQYSLGLLLGEEKRYAEAARYLEAAAAGMPDRSRVHYNLGILLDYLGRDAKAESALRRALELQPDNMEYLNAVAQYYFKRQMFQEAKRFAEQIISNHPSSRLGSELLDLIKRRIQTGSQ